MPETQLGTMVEQLRRAALLPDGAGLTDSQLLELFLCRRDDAAFEILVRRHGPMVLGVCRRILGDWHDAEDAFQATFLVLTRKAAAVIPRDRLGNWLYGVACRTALKARTASARRHMKERRARAMARRQTADDPPAQDWEPLLDQELSRLPDKYRVPLVLCELEGKGRRETARQLGLAEGTLSSRLARARRMLAKRLASRGVVLSAGSLAAVLSAKEAAAAVPGPLVASTVKAAALFAAGSAPPAGISAVVVTLTEGVLKSMFFTKLKQNRGAGVASLSARHRDWACRLPYVGGEQHATDCL
jgi:RNA polymerase sigma factor (sigma-70 family)